jgi:2-dehydropantoate 2-reductase
MVGFSLRWLIFGAGAIGTYFGGRLMLSGGKVVFLERPEGLIELRQRGLRLVINHTEHCVPHPLIFTSLEDALITPISMSP